MVCEMHSWKKSSIPRQNAHLIMFQRVSEAPQKNMQQCNVKARCCVERVQRGFELERNPTGSLIAQVKHNQSDFKQNMCRTLMRC